MGSLLSRCKSGQSSAILLYGPDKGLISYTCTEISKLSGKEIKSISYKDAENKGLDIILNNASLFNKGEIIKITDVPQTIDNSFKALLLGKIHNFPILIADELSPSSSLRKFFEAEESLASFGCYAADEKATALLIRQTIAESSKKITSDAVAYLAMHLAGDRFLIMSELGKLLLYTHDKDNIELSDVSEIISRSLMTSPDKLCISFAKGNAGQYFIELEKLLAENISPVWIIRALIRYYINLYIAVSLKDRGESLESAIQSIKPPIFFKYVQDFRQIVSISETKGIINVLKNLEMAEIECKSSGASADKICHLLFFKTHNRK